MKAIKIFFVSVIFVGLNISSQAQSYITNAEVISSGGGKTNGGNYSNFGVIGETFVNDFIVGGSYNGSSSGFVFLADYTVGLSETLKDQNMNIWPNPAKDKLFIESNSDNIGIDRLDLINMNGDKVYQQNALPLTNQIELDISGYPDGIFLLRIYFQDKVLTRKVIIQH